VIVHRQEVISMVHVVPRNTAGATPGNGDRQYETTTHMWRAMPWVAIIVVTMLLFEVVSLVWIGLIAPVAALALAAVQRRRPPVGVQWVGTHVDRQDLVAIAALYVVVVGLFRLAFRGFGTGRVAGLFLSFAAGLLLGVVGPVIYMVWRRGRSLRDLGIGAHCLREAIALGLMLASIQFVMTLWGYDLPEPVDWVPLLFLSLVVGAFEAVFFRGFIQGRLEASFGAGFAVAGAATLYALYHVGYGMGTEEMAFLFGLGILYAIAYRIVGNLVVLWPLLTPLGAFFNNLEASDIELPWASIAGFADVAIVMAVVLLLARRHERRRERPPVLGDLDRVRAPT
jgi:membrane protease YdiL (CAAX protease family)